MNPCLYSCYFGRGLQDQWSRLATVLTFSAGLHLPGWDITVERVEKQRIYQSAMGIAAHEENTQKLDRWLQIVNDAPEGQQLLLIDVDTAILRSLDDVWTQPFDVAYTSKPKGSRFPLNGGVLFLRVNDASRSFVQKWATYNRTFLTDRAYRSNPLRKTHGGINQAALGAVLREANTHTQIATLPCVEWNCEDESWAQFNQQTTRILHVKSGLRRAALKIHGARIKETHVARVWQRLEQQAGQERVA